MKSESVFRQVFFEVFKKEKRFDSAAVCFSTPLSPFLVHQRETRDGRKKLLSDFVFVFSS